MPQHQDERNAWLHLRQEDIQKESSIVVDMFEAA
jgi:hypothetical protein